MVGTRLRTDQVRRLADQVREKILANEELVAQAEGEISIRIFPKGTGHNIKLLIQT